MAMMYYPTGEPGEMKVTLVPLYGIPGFPLVKVYK